MATMIEIILKLEKRIIALEKTLGIVPDKADLVHPKSVVQYQIGVDELKEKLGEIK